MSEKNNSIAYVDAGITVLLWSSAFPAVKYVLNWFSPGSLMLFRFLVASATLICVMLVKKARLPAKEDIPYAMAGGAIGIFGYMLFFNMGTDMVKSGISSFIIATAPIFSMLLSAVFLKEKLTLRYAAGICVSAAGLLLIAVGQVRETALNFGILLLLAAAVFTSCYNIIQRKISYKYTPIECTSYSIVFATALMLVFSPELARDLPKAPILADLIIVYLGVCPAALAYLLWNYALGKAKKVTNVTDFLYLTPFLATSLSYIFLREALSALSFAGGAAIIAGMIIANSNTKNPKGQSLDPVEDAA